MSRKNAMRIDLIPMSTRPARDTLRSRLDDLLTRCFYSASGYVFESDPHAVAEDDDLLRAFGEIRTNDRHHAQVLGRLIQAQGGVPQPGVFPWWDQDLNYLTVPTLGSFVVEVLQDELRRYDELIARWSADDLTGRAALEAVRAEKARQLGDLRPRAAAAVAREVESRRAAAVALKKAREARLVKEKAAAEAARKAKTAAKSAPAATAAVAPSTALLDPNEPGISKKEKGRRAVMRIRAALGIATPGAARSAAAAPAAAGSDLPDPNEPGISPKEKARRTMLKMRAAQGGGAPATAAATPGPALVAAPGADIPDPSEAGISPKEKARRTMLRMRAQAVSATGSPPAAPVLAGASPPEGPSAPTPTASAASAEADPDEAGISPKEKARRQVARLRAKKG